ncbi:hypothetical protein [Streptomyces sp. NPDC003710]
MRRKTAGLIAIAAAVLALGSGLSATAHTQHGSAPKAAVPASNGGPDLPDPSSTSGREE